MEAVTSAVVQYSSPRMSTLTLREALCKTNPHLNCEADLERMTRAVGFAHQTTLFCKRNTKEIIIPQIVGVGESHSTWL